MLSDEMPMSELAVLEDEDMLIGENNDVAVITSGKHDVAVVMVTAKFDDVVVMVTGKGDDVVVIVTGKGDDVTGACFSLTPT